MRHVLIAGAFAAGTLLATTAANAQAAYQAGGPNRIGNMCRVVTDANSEVDAYGYYAPCGYQAVAQAPAPRHAGYGQAAYEAGGPSRLGAMCRVTTDANGEIDSYGYYAPCQ